MLRPAAPDTGIVFFRSDLPGNPAIPAPAHNVVDTRMATVLEKDGARVSTVEHLMSAFFGLGIDNAYVDVSAEEVPIMDGSAATFVFLLQQAGVEEQAAPKKYLRVLKPVTVEQGDKRVSRAPYPGFKVGFSIEFRHPVFEQTETTVDIDFGEVSFVKEVARARTFGFTQDVEAMRNAGLGRGVSPSASTSNNLSGNTGIFFSYKAGGTGEQSPRLWNLAAYSVSHYAAMGSINSSNTV